MPFKVSVGSSRKGAVDVVFISSKWQWLVKFLACIVWFPLEGKLSFNLYSLPLKSISSRTIEKHDCLWERNLWLGGMVSWVQGSFILSTSRHFFFYPQRNLGRGLGCAKALGKEREKVVQFRFLLPSFPRWNTSPLNPSHQSLHE